MQLDTERTDVKHLAKIIDLRLSVGLLGEKDRANWWPSLWFSSSAMAFLSPIYGEQAAVARYHGVVEAARRVHDDRIGVGRVFHLFRLPEALERRLHDAVTTDRVIDLPASVQTADDAEACLSQLAGSVEARPGPLRVGNASDLDSHAWLRTLAGHYLAAFRSSRQTFPYFAEIV